jgi:hypothetical protein
MKLVCDLSKSAKRTTIISGIHFENDGFILFDISGVEHWGSNEILHESIHFWDLTNLSQVVSPLSGNDKDICLGILREWRECSILCFTQGPARLDSGNFSRGDRFTLNRRAKMLGELLKLAVSQVSSPNCKKIFCEITQCGFRTLTIWEVSKVDWGIISRCFCFWNSSIRFDSMITMWNRFRFQNIVSISSSIVLIPLTQSRPVLSRTSQNLSWKCS